VTVFAAGDEPTADQLNSTLLAIKSSAQIVNNSNTFVNDAELTLAVAANSSYAITLALLFVSNATPDIKWTLTFPSGAICSWGAIRLVSSVAALTGDADFGGYSSATSGSSSVSAGGTALTQLALTMGSLTTGATAGSLTLQWAQNTQNASDTTVAAGSYLLLQRG